MFHNLSVYDSHFLLKAVACFLDGDLSLSLKEKYISFTKKLTESKIKFNFIDSFKFMSSSLDKLASYLRKFNILKSQIPNCSEEKINPLLRKGVFPYKHIDCEERLNETELSPIECFYSSLSSQTISEKYYEHGKNVWSKFQMKDLGEY